MGRDRFLGPPESVPLTGSCQNAAGFNINGIDATAGTAG